MTDDQRTAVWYLIGSLQVGGANRNLVDLANRLDHDRFDVTVWTILPENPLAAELSSEVTHRSLDANGKFDVGAALSFVRAVRRRSPDILHSFLYYDNLLARLAGVSTPDTAVVSSVLSVPTDPSRLRETVDRLTLPLCDHVVANSRDGACLARGRGVPDRRITTIPNGREIGQFRDASASPELRSSLGVPPEAPLVGTVGRLEPVKGHSDLLRAWPTVRETHTDAHLVLVGDGSARGDLESLVRELGCRDSVTLTGTRSDIPELLATMDLFAFPSHYEGLPGAVIEAMAAGLPIVGTRVPGTVELIDDGETGVLVDANSPDDLATAITDLLSDTDRGTQLGRHASRAAAAQFAMQQMVDEYTELYVRLASLDR